MKSKLLTFVFLLAATTGFAQIEKGTWFASGGIGFNNNKIVTPSIVSFDLAGNPIYDDLENSNSNFQLSLGAGYTFRENQAMGFAFGINNSKTISQNTTGQVPVTVTRTDKDNSFFIAPFYRYYYFCAPQFAFIGQVHVPITFTGGELIVEYSNGQPTDRSVDPSSFGVGAWITPSFAWFPKSTWSLEASIGQLGFNTQSYKDGNNNQHTTNNFDATIWLLQPSLTFTYYFRGDE